MPFTALLLAAALQSSGATVTTRVVLNPDLTDDALRSEMLASARRIEPGAELGVVALRFVAEEFERLGRFDEARAWLARADTLARGSSDDSERALLAPAHARLHGHESVRRWLGTIEDWRQQVRAACLIARDVLERGDRGGMADAAATLASRHRHGWDPRADAWLTRLYEESGRPDAARSFREEVLEGPYDSSEELRAEDALGILLEAELASRGPRAGEALLARYEAGDEQEHRVDRLKLDVLEAYLALDDPGRARALQATMVDPLHASVGAAEIALWLQEQGLTDESSAAFSKAAADAGRDGVLALCRVARVVARGGSTAAVDSVLGAALELAQEQPSEGMRALAAKLIATTAVDVDRGLFLAAVEDQLDPLDPQRYEALARGYVRKESLPWLARVYGALPKPDMRFGYLQDATNTYEPESASAHFSSELARFLVDRSRELPDPSERAWLIARILQERMAAPPSPSALHPFSLPPTLAGEWSAPSDPGAAHALLLRALGEHTTPAVRGMRARRLACHPDGELLEFDGLLHRLPFHYVVARLGEEVVLVDGSPQAVARLASLASWSESDEALLDYALLSIAARSSRAGRYRCVESARALEVLRTAGATLPGLALRPARVVGRSEESSAVELNLLVGTQLERIAATVDGDGRVSLEPRALIAQELALDGEFAIPGGRWERRRSALPEAYDLYREDRAAGAYALGLVFATGFGEGGVRIDSHLARAWFDEAAAHGFDAPLRRCGLALRDGSAGLTDEVLAAEWLARSAEHE